MRKTQRLVTHALLFVLSTLLLKTVLLPAGLSDCNEFAHIHRFAISKIFTKAATSAVISSQSDKHESEDENCHSAQSIFSASLVPVQIFVWENPLLKVVFKCISNLENRFESPDLDTPRRPPRSA